MELSIDEALRRGDSAQAEGKVLEAERYFHAVLSVQAEHPIANHNFGLLLASCGKHDEAIQFLETAVKNRPDREQYWVSLIQSLIKLGRIHDARVVLSWASPRLLAAERLQSLAILLNPSSHLDFFYKYLHEIGVFNSTDEHPVNGANESIPLLTNGFLNWFETQNWEAMRLLELGSGGSTLYFSGFFESVTSYENNQDWFEKLQSKISDNVALFYVDSVSRALGDGAIENLDEFDVVLIDAAENRANLTRWLITKAYRGVIFFDNSDWYRKSIDLLVNEGFIEIPFFGLKPTEDWVSCTSVLASPPVLRQIFHSHWQSLPKLTWSKAAEGWDEEDNIQY